MRRIVQTTATISFASSGRRDLLFELFALHHQLAVVPARKSIWRPKDIFLAAILNAPARRRIGCSNWPMLMSRTRRL